MALAQEDQSKFLMDMKLMFLTGMRLSSSFSRFDNRLSIHHLHFVVEQILREKAKKMQFKGTLQQIGFEKIIERVNKSANIPDYQELISLNTMRNDAQHRGIIASRTNVMIQAGVVERFLNWSYKRYFDVEYSKLRLEDFITNQNVKTEFELARNAIDKGDPRVGAERVFHALGKFKTDLYAFFYDPRADAQKFTFEAKEVSLASIFGDFVLKLTFIDDTSVLTDLFQYNIGYPEKGKPPYFGYSGNAPIPKDIDECRKYYDRALEIVLRYQDRFPSLG